MDLILAEAGRGAPPFLKAVIMVTISTVLYLIYQFAVQSGAKKSPQTKGTLTLQPGILIALATAFFLFAGLGVLYIVYNFLTPKEGEPWSYWVLMLVGFALSSAGIYGLFQLFVFRTIVDDETIIDRGIFSVQEMKWTDITSVGYGDILKCFILKDNQGQVMKISTDIIGSADLAHRLIQNLPLEMIQPARGAFHHLNVDLPETPREDT